MTKGPTETVEIGGREWKLRLPTMQEAADFVGSQHVDSIIDGINAVMANIRSQLELVEAEDGEEVIRYSDTGGQFLDLGERPPSEFLSEAAGALMQFVEISTAGDFDPDRVDYVTGWKLFRACMQFHVEHESPLASVPGTAALTTTRNSSESDGSGSASSDGTGD